MTRRYDLDGVDLQPSQRFDACFVAPSAEIAADVEIGLFSVIHGNVKLARGVSIGSHTVIHAGTTIDEGTTVGESCILGRPVRLSPRTTVKPESYDGLSVGRGCVIGTGVIVAVGSRIADRVYLGDRAYVRELVSIGELTMIGAMAIVERASVVGARVKLQTGSYVTSYMTVEDDVFFGPFVSSTDDNFMGRTEQRHAVKKGSVIRRGARVGSGTVLLPSVEIGEEAVVGAGSVVTRDVPAGIVAFGNPARYVRDVPDDEKLSNGT